MKFETLWALLCSCSARILNHGSSQDSFCLAVEVGSGVGQNESALEPRDWAILQSSLLGTSPIVTAIEHSLALSTVKFAASRALEACGAIGDRRAAPVVLAAAAHATLGVPKLGEIEGMDCAVEHRRATIFRLPRIEQEARDRLSTVEFIAIQGCLEHQTAADTAARSGMSARRIHDARARAFRKLQVANRLELIAHLVRIKYGAPTAEALAALGYDARIQRAPRRPLHSRPEVCPHCASPTGPFRELQGAWLCRACARTFTTPEVPPMDREAMSVDVGSGTRRG